MFCFFLPSVKTQQSLLMDLGTAKGWFCCWCCSGTLINLWYVKTGFIIAASPHQQWWKILARMFGAKKLILMDRLLFFRSYSLTLNKCFESLLYRLFLPFQAIYKCLSNSADQCRGILCLKKPYKRKNGRKITRNWFSLMTPVFCWHVLNTP